jgi:hypothetical protein
VAPRRDSDWFVTPNQATADVMIAQGVPAAKVLPFGFPVPAQLAPRSSARAGERPRLLLMLNPGKRDAVELAASLASLDVDLTVTVGKDADFRDAVVAATAGKAESARLDEPHPRAHAVLPPGHQQGRRRRHARVRRGRHADDRHAG